MKTQIHITYRPNEDRTREADMITFTHEDSATRLADLYELLRVAFAAQCHPPVSEIIIKPL